MGCCFEKPIVVQEGNMDVYRFTFSDRMFIANRFIRYNNVEFSPFYLKTEQGRIYLTKCKYILQDILLDSWIICCDV